MVVDVEVGEVGVGGGLGVGQQELTATLCTYFYYIVTKLITM